MSISARRKFIEKIEKSRKSRVLCYLTSLRQNVQAQIAQDAVRVIYDHLLRMGDWPIEKLDLFIVSNGGQGTVPWRLVSVFREVAQEFNVLIPFRAYSAATLIALGADEIVMHPFGEMGPIDPTVANEFNPRDAKTNQRIGISVEDVRAYVAFIKDTVGIRHEDELVEAIKSLTDKVHPLAIGNVERFVSQSRMVARKILKTRKNTLDDHAIDEIVETMASKLYFHGHPISRREAKDELGLHVNTTPSRTLESAMWDLYLAYEELMQNRVEFDPGRELVSKMEGEKPPEEGQEAEPPFVENTLVHAVVESSGLTSAYRTRIRHMLAGMNDQGLLIQEQKLEAGWDHQSDPSVPAGPDLSP